MIERHQVLDWAEKKDFELEAGRFNATVQVVHADGSMFLLRNAFLVFVNDLWVVCFSEHNGFHVWHKEDLKVFRQFAYATDDEIEAVTVP